MYLPELSLGLVAVGSSARVQFHPHRETTLDQAAGNLNHIPKISSRTAPTPQNWTLRPRPARQSGLILIVEVEKEFIKLEYLRHGLGQKMDGV